MLDQTAPVTGAIVPNGYPVLRSGDSPHRVVEDHGFDELVWFGASWSGLGRHIEVLDWLAYASMLQIGSASAVYEAPQRS